MNRDKFFATFKKPKADIEQIEKLISKFGGNITLNEVLEYVKSHSPYIHLPYKCPKCNGQGYLVREYNGYPSGLPDSGSVYEPAFDYRICDLCEGMGYTNREMKPKFETKIIGWE